MRNQGVDFIKGMAIMAVVLLHISYTFEDAVMRPLLGGMWHVPVFFLVGGFFCYEAKEESWGECWEFIKHKAWRLYVPATLCYLVAMICHNLFVHIGWYPLGHLNPSTGEPFRLWSASEYPLQIAKALIGYGEPVMGAMWFVYVLLFAHIGLKVLKTLIRKEWVLWVLLFVLQSVSWYLTNVKGLTIARVNNTVTAMFMLHLGGWAYEHREWAHKWWIVVMSLVVYVCSAIWCGNVVLNKNLFHDPVMLNVTALAVLILLYTLYRLLSQTFIASAVAYIGKHSYAVMAGQILGFYLCTSLLLTHFNHIPIGRFTAIINERHWFVGVLYFVMGVMIPLALVNGFQLVRNKLHKT